MFISKMKFGLCFIWVTFAVLSCTQNQNTPYTQTKPVPVPDQTTETTAPTTKQTTTTTQLPGDQVDLSPSFTVGPPAEVSLKEGETLNFSITATGQSEVTYSSQCANICPSGITVSPLGVVTWNPGFNDAGIYDVRFSATDVNGLVGVTEYVRIRVANVDRKPIISSVMITGNDPVSPSTFTCDVVATDPDLGDIIRISRNWTVNGHLPLSGHIGSKTVSISDLGLSGDVIRCEATAIDMSNVSSDVFISDPTTIPNSPPVIISSGPILTSVQGSAIAESVESGLFRVGDLVTCAVSFYDREGGTILASSMKLIALPLSSSDGILPSPYQDFVATTDSFQTTSEILATFTGSQVSYNISPPIEFFGSTFPAGAKFGLSYGTQSFVVTKKYAHRPLTCLTTLLDGNSTVSLATFVSRIKNTAPKISSVTVEANPVSPNILPTQNSQALLRSGGQIRCTASYQDVDGDVLVAGVKILNKRGQVVRIRQNPDVAWSQACDQLGSCTVTGLYTLKRWTDIGGSDADRENFSDIHQDVLSCEADISDITTYGPLTSTTISAGSGGELTVQDSPPTIISVTGPGSVVLSGNLRANGSLTQTLYSKDVLTPLTFAVSDPDGDQVSLKLGQSSNGQNCGDYGISFSADTTRYPNMVVSEVGSIPLMAYPHRSRDCKITVYSESVASTGGAPLDSNPLTLSLIIPNRPPKLFCGTTSEITAILNNANLNLAYAGLAKSTLNYYLKSGIEDSFGSVTTPGQRLGFDELDTTSTPESERTSFLCTVIDLDGMSSGSEVAFVSILGDSVSSGTDAFNWNISEVGGDTGCSYFLSDGITKSTLATSPFGASSSVITRKINYSMGIKSCAGKISVTDGNPLDPSSLKSNEVNFAIAPKLKIDLSSVTLDAYGRLKMNTNPTIMDTSRYQFITPDQGNITNTINLPSTIPANKVPAFSVARITGSALDISYSDVRTEQNMPALGLSSVTSPGFAEMSTSPLGVSFILASKEVYQSSTFMPLTDEQQTSAFFMEDGFSSSINQKNLNLSLTLNATNISDQSSTQKTISRNIKFGFSQALGTDLTALPRRPSLIKGIYGFSGRQVLGYSSCPSMSSCVGRETSISSGETHTCFVADQGSVFCFGGNTRGQLGDTYQGGPGNLFDAREPLTPMVKNIGSNCSVDYQGSQSPCPMNGVDSEKIVEVSVGVAHSCVLTEGGRVLCFGDNTYGQLGTAQNILALPGDSSFNLPSPEADYVVINQNLNPVPLTNVVQVSAGPWHTCALTKDGDVFCWGANPSTSLNLSDVPSQFCGSGSTNRCVANPVKIDSFHGAIQISSGGYGSRLSMNGVSPGVQYIGGTTCALMNDRSVKCMGDGIYGLSQSTTQLLTPVSSAYISRLASFFEEYVMANKGPSSSPPARFEDSVMGVAVGKLTACALSLSSYSCWGGGVSGDVEDPFMTGAGLSSLGITSNLSTNLVPVSKTTSLGSVVADKSMGVGFSCEIFSDSTHRSSVRCFGKNHFIEGLSESSALPSHHFGSLGYGGQDEVIPGAISAVVLDEAGAEITDVKAISSGSFHACFVRQSGQVYCIGSNFAGQTGVTSGQPSAVSLRARLVATGAAVKSCSQLIRPSLQTR
jgi:Regulator of chromosome condensation (RCC1) repeat/Putative Ig domain